MTLGLENLKNYADLEYQGLQKLQINVVIKDLRR